MCKQYPKTRLPIAGSNSSCQRGRQRPLRLVAGLVLLLMATPALAQFGVRVIVEADGEFRSMLGTQEAAESITRVFVGPPPNNVYSLAIASAQVSHGRLQVNAYHNSEGAIGSQATARAEFEDTLVIQAAVPPGTMGYFFARVRADGSLHASGYNIGDQPDQPGSANAQYFARFEADTAFDGFVANLSGTLHSNGATTGSQEGTINRRVEFTFGEPIEIKVTLFALADSDGNASGGSGLAQALYGNSAYWTGLDQVFTLDDDQPLPTFTVSSASGTDYRIDFSQDPLFRHGFDH